MQTISFEKQTLSYLINEEMKQLRTNLQFSGEGKKVVLVTSTIENEGKSTITLELARSLAELGKKVLLVDADMRKSVLQDRTTDSGKVKNGLSHYLCGQATLEDSLCLSVEDQCLFILMAGRVPPNPSELLAGEKMKKLIEWARTKFDYVLLDCPPINMVVDAAVVAPISDGAIFVVKANSVSRKMVQTALRKINRTSCPILGIVLNEVDMKGRGKYGYNRYYKRYSRYGYYRHEYAKTETPKSDS